MKKSVILVILTFIILGSVKVLLFYFPHEIEITTIQGLLYEDILKKYGDPKSKIEFVLENNAYEYRYGLYKYFPKPINEKIDILELSWYRKYSLYPNFVAWFKKSGDNWVVLEGLRWTRWIIY